MILFVVKRSQGAFVRALMSIFCGEAVAPGQPKQLRDVINLIYGALHNSPLCVPDGRCCAHFGLMQTGVLLWRYVGIGGRNHAAD